jgi:hypothetical protein
MYYDLTSALNRHPKRAYALIEELQFRWTRTDIPVQEL